MSMGKHGATRELKQGCQEANCFERCGSTVHATTETGYHQLHAYGLNVLLTTWNNDKTAVKKQHTCCDDLDANS